MVMATLLLFSCSEYQKVLKAPDIPSVLLEIGFLSSTTDRARLVDPVWRDAMHQAILGALRDWAVADAAEATQIRQ